MKASKLLILSLFLGFALACNKDDGDPTPPPVQNVDRSANLLATGASANDILSNNNFDNLQIEIAFVTGFRPTQNAINNFVAYLRRHTFKENIDVIFTELASPDEEDLTLQEIATLERENRTAYNNDGTLAIYIYFADAPAEGDDLENGLVTLGAVYRNTSMVIYESTVARLSNLSNIITRTDVETATLNHEFGHLFGLVNLGTPAINDHEDIQTDDDGEPILDSEGNTMGNQHCNVEGCLMRAELQFGISMMEMMESMGVVPVLDPECVLDLLSNGGR